MPTCRRYNACTRLKFQKASFLKRRHFERVGNSSRRLTHLPATSLTVISGLALLRRPRCASAQRRMMTGRAAARCVNTTSSLMRRGAAHRAISTLVIRIYSNNDTPPRSRGLSCPSHASLLTLVQNRGCKGRPGAGRHPRPLRQEMHTACTGKTGEAGNIPAFPCAVV